jgi:hypothetical protein
MTDGAIHAERPKGRTLRDLAEENGMTPEGIRIVVAREGREQIDEIELALLAATNTNEVVAFLVPNHGGKDFDLAVEYVQWVVRELTERGIRVRVHHRDVENGIVLALEGDFTPRRGA